MKNNSQILITGGTGSFGKAFVKIILKKYKPKRIVIFSRDEMKQWHMAKDFEKHSCIRYFIGDVRDKDRVYRALDGIDYVIHAAATKIVPTAEYNPFETVKTNIIGGMNVIDAAIDKNIKKVVALSTDKACDPINFYGATKLASDKLFISSNSYSGKSRTRLSVVRYGNVMGSRGSIIPFFLESKKTGILPVTDTNMTRFMISLDSAVDLVLHAFKDMVGGEIYVKKIPSMKVVDIAKAICPNCKIKIIGIRPGEKIHEKMISSSDSVNTFEFKDHYKILPSMYNWSVPQKVRVGKKVKKNFEYASNTNTQWMEVSELRNWIKKNQSFFESFYN